MRFYSIDERYLDYLRQFDDKVPNISSTKNNKFYLGIVLEIDGYKYYAPVSSFNQKQKTNFVIKDNDINISSVRICFMVPVKDEHIEEFDIDKIKDETYKDLCNAEIIYCRKNKEVIKELADKVYKWGNNRRYYLAKSICHFKLLEAKCDEYLIDKN